MGPDGNVWFTENRTNKVARLNSAGVISEFSLPTPNSQPDGITTGPLASLWLVEHQGSRWARVTTDGAVTEFRLSEGSQPDDIVASSGTTMWLTEFGVGGLARVTANGRDSEILLTASDSMPHGIARGPGNSIWFVERNANKIGTLPA